MSNKATVDSKYVSHLGHLAKNQPFARYICLSQSHYLKQLLISMIQKRLEKLEKTKPEVYVFYGKTLDIHEWMDKAESSSFFSSQKILILKDFKSVESKKLKQILSAPEHEMDNQKTVLILEEGISLKEAGAQVSKASNNGWHIVDDATLTKKQWMGRLQKRWEWYGLNPPVEFIEKIMKLTLMDLDLAIEQVDRWGLLYHGNDAVDWNRIDTNHLQPDQAIIFNLSDALLSHDHAKSLSIYFDLTRQGKSSEEIFYFLLNHCILLGKVKTTLELAQSSAAVYEAFKELNRYRLGKLIQQASSLPIQRIYESIEKLLIIDKKSKSQSDTTLETMLTTTIASL